MYLCDVFETFDIFGGLLLKCVMQLQLGNLCHGSPFLLGTFDSIWEEPVSLSCHCWTGDTTFHTGKVLRLASCCEANVSLQVILYKQLSKGKVESGYSWFSLKFYPSVHQVSDFNFFILHSGKQWPLSINPCALGIQVILTPLLLSSWFLKSF